MISLPPKLSRQHSGEFEVLQMPVMSGTVILGHFLTMAQSAPNIFCDSLNMLT